MSIKTILLGAAILAGLSAWGQTTPSGSTRATGGSSVTFTNPVGGVYSADEFAVQLQNLQTAIEQTLPLLTAFTQTYSNSAAGSHSNSAAGGQKSVTGEVSGLLSNVLHQGATNATFGPTGSNALTTLEGLLKTNASGTASTNANAETIQDLIALQNHLQSSMVILQKLNVGGSTSATNAPGAMAPTGR
jgi:hypothetical protein